MKETFLYKAFYDTNLDNEVITLIDCREAMDKYTKFMSLGFMDYYWKFKEFNGHKLTAEGWPTMEKLYDLFISNFDVKDFVK